MKCIIAGSRTITNRAAVFNAVRMSEFSDEITQVVCGGAKGVDALGAEWAALHELPVKYFYPNWELGKKAGPIRNEKMAKYADALVLVWDGESNGSRDMYEKAQKIGLRIYLEVIK